MRPPSSDCSASTECGGNRRRSVALRASSVAALSAILPPSLGAFQRPSLSVLRLLGLDHDLELDVHVRVQVQLDLMIADDTQRTVGQPNLAALDLDAMLADRLGNVDGADRAEQLAFGACLHLDLQRQALELLRASLSGLELRGGLRLELRTARLELRLVLGRRERRLALRNQVIPGEPRLYADEIADPAHIVDFLQQYDFHLSTLMRRRVAAPARSLANADPCTAGARGSARA